MRVSPPLPPLPGRWAQLIKKDHRETHWRLFPVCENKGVEDHHNVNQAQGKQKIFMNKYPLRITYPVTKIKTPSTIKCWPITENHPVNLSMIGRSYSQFVSPFASQFICPLVSQSVVSRRQHGRVVSLSNSQFSSSGFESRFDHHLDICFILGPSSNPVNSLLVCVRPVGILNDIMINLNCFSWIYAINTVDDKSRLYIIWVHHRHRYYHHQQQQWQHHHQLSIC